MKCILVLFALMVVALAMADEETPKAPEVESPILDLEGAESAQYGRHHGGGGGYRDHYGGGGGYRDHYGGGRDYHRGGSRGGGRGRGRH